MIDRFTVARSVLVIAPHPDDEVLGCGGTIARLASGGCRVDVAVVTEGRPPAYDVARTALVKGEAEAAHRRLGIAGTHWLGQPAAQLAETPHSQVNGAIHELLRALRPEILFVPFIGDMHLDHQMVFLSSLVAARPHQAQYPTTILAYETLSETNWNAPYVTPSFVPQVFVDIGDFLPAKLEAMACFASQTIAFPHERSLEALTALATLRGATVHRAAAEAFVLVRHVS
ncbi:PIG-L family deacetylase [Jiella sp. MQZ9-1]|uniref:PIG-L family deacetylase n=1 Tax=Jiella flava TaxID=2816857 RepID=A0A939JX63_9HYPH|nr:PIG-L deacetylase family protein [Jiella flava]MBO0663036.1 PIG-L family deacetylase [Jiella flava]MCD2471455.1 PIG-L family deacetylase [Jiella flava]